MSKDAKKKFAPPTRKEAEEYARSIGYTTFDYNVFCAYHETRGWKPKGSTKQMVSWKAAIRTFYYRTDEYKDKREGITKPAPRCVICGEPATGVKSGKSFCSKTACYHKWLGQN